MFVLGSASLGVVVEDEGPGELEGDGESGVDGREREAAVDANILPRSVYFLALYEQGIRRFNK